MNSDPLADTQPGSLLALAKETRERCKRIEEHFAAYTKAAHAERFEFRLVSGAALLMAAASLAISCLR